MKVGKHFDNWVLNEGVRRKTNKAVPILQCYKAAAVASSRPDEDDINIIYLDGTGGSSRVASMQQKKLLDQTVELEQV